MRCRDFANIDVLLDQLQAGRLFAVELRSATDRGHYHALFRVAFRATVGGTHFSLATLRHGMVGRAAYFVPEAREELKQEIAALIAKFEEPDPAVVRLRERLSARANSALTPVHHLYAVAREGRRHSAR